MFSMTSKTMVFQNHVRLSISHAYSNIIGKSLVVKFLVDLKHAVICCLSAKVVGMMYMCLSIENLTDKHSLQVI